MCSRVADARERRSAALRPISAPATCRLGCAWAAIPCWPALPWREAWDIERDFGPAEPGDRAALSRAAAAAAETGTLFLVSGADNPTTLNFLPEAHTILIAASDIVGSYEEACDRLRAIMARGAAPHRQPHQRAVADGRHRADHRARRAWSKPAPRADPRLAGPPRHGSRFPLFSMISLRLLPFPPEVRLWCDALSYGRRLSPALRPVRGGLSCVSPYG